jgi:hypothetical protein
MTNLDTEQRIMCLSARMQLDSAAEAQLLDLLRGPVDWERLWALGQAHEVIPLLTTNLRRLPTPVPAAWMERAKRRFYAILMRNTALAEELLRVLGALRAVGIVALPVKGIILAETMYGGLGLRQCADLDVLAHPRDLPAARDVLRNLGYAQNDTLSFDEAHHPFHDPPYFRKIAGAEVCLELHQALWDARFFEAEADALWRRMVEAPLHGARVATLSPEDTLLHLAIHRSRSALRLRFVCDIAELLRRHGATLDWSYVLGQARALRARTALFSALGLAQELLAAPLPPEVLPQLGVGRLKRSLLDQTCGVTALFRASPTESLAEQQHVTLRLLEQDGVGHIIQAFGYTMIRNRLRRLHNRGRIPAGNQANGAAEAHEQRAQT